MKSLSFKDEFVAFWGDEQDAGRKIAEAAVLEAFREDLISSGKASELLDLTRQEFLDLLGRKSIPVGARSLKSVAALKQILTED